LDKTLKHLDNFVEPNQLFSLVFAFRITSIYSFFLCNASPKLLIASSGVKIHLYQFGAEHRNEKLTSFACSVQDGPSLLDMLLLSQVL
jgi:GDP-L-galactose phosphorylase